MNERFAFTRAACCAYVLIALHLQLANAADVTAVAVSHDKKTVILGDRVGDISAWSIDSGEQLWRLGGRGAAIRSIGLLPSDRWVIAVDGPNLLVMIYEGRDKLRSILDYGLTVGGEPSMTAAAAFRGDGARLVLGGTLFAESFVLDVFTFVEKDYRDTIVLKEYEAGSVSAPGVPEDMGIMHAWRNEGNPISQSVRTTLTYFDLEDKWTDFAWCAKDRIVAVSGKGYLVGWDIDSDKPRAALSSVSPSFIRRVTSNRDADRSLRSVACAQNGMMATVSAAGRYGSVQVWNSKGVLEQFAQPRRDFAESPVFERVALSEDAKCVVTLGGSGYILWRVTPAGLSAATAITGSGKKPLQRIPKGSPIAAVDDRRFVLAAEGGAWLLDCKTGSLVRSFGSQPSLLKVRSLK